MMDGDLARRDWIPPPSEASPVLSPLTPLDSARELLRRDHQNGAHRTLHHQQGTFYEWTGTHYTETATEEIRATVYNFLDGAVQTVKGEEVPFSPTKSKVANVLEALAAACQLHDVARAPAWLDGTERAPAAEFLACSNGLLHLPTRTMMAATPAFFGLNAVDYPCDAIAPEPMEWLSFLTRIWPEDQAAIDTLQELFGLLLTTDTSQQKAFLLIGPRRSGKGTISRILTALLGRENVAGPTLSSLQQNFGLAPLIGKPLAIISDARLSGRSDASTVVERLLAITGEDAITIDRKHREAWTGRLPTRFLILTNELPRLTDASGALAGRFIILVMTVSFYGREDTGLTNKLLAELPGILRWSLTGYDRLTQRGHFVQPPSSDQTVREMEDLASPIGAFLRDRCEVRPAHAVECDKLFGAWVKWCQEQHRDRTGTVQSFGRDLRAAVPDLKSTYPRAEGERVRKYQGIRLIRESTAAIPEPDGPPPRRFPDDDWRDDWIS